jgi:hypothetical protein
MQGYEKFGLNVDEKGDITYREWAPGANEAYLIGDFSMLDPKRESKPELTIRKTIGTGEQIRCKKTRSACGKSLSQAKTVCRSYLMKARSRSVVNENNGRRF